MRVIVATGLYQMSTRNVKVEEMTEFDCRSVKPARPKGLFETLRMASRDADVTSDGDLNVRAFHGNGPNNYGLLGQPGEDTRMLPIPASEDGGDFRVAFFMSDWEKHPDEKDPSGFASSRVQYLMVMSLADRGKRGRFSEGPVLRLTPAWTAADDAAGEPSLGNFEKNWSPFLVDTSGAAPEVYAFQWLESPRSSSVVFRVDLATGKLLERLEVPGVSGPLRRALGVGRERAVSGGTPAVRLNGTTFLAVGHTVNYATRSYGMFGYVFSSRPPFRILAVTPEFTCDCDDPRPQEWAGVKQPKWPNPPQQLSFMPPDAAKDSVIFPTGLSKLYVQGRAALLLSLTNSDHDSIMMAFRPRELLSRLVPLQYED